MWVFRTAVAAMAVCWLPAAGAIGGSEEPGLTVPLALFGAEELSSRGASTARRSAADLRFFGMYSAVIGIGGQRFCVQLDTGSSNLVIPAADCDGCAIGLRRYRHEDSATSEQVGCRSETCSGYCNPTECRASKGAMCDMRDAPPPWALDLLTEDSAIDPAKPLCADDINWRGADGRGCERFRENAEWCGEGESVARCPASCGSCGRCCTASNGCFFEQTYADQTGGTGALYVDNLALFGLNRAGDRAVAQARITFGAASLVTHSAEVPFSPLGVDGVLGIGYSWLNCHPTCVPAPLDALLGALSPTPPSGRVETGGQHNMFALCLTTPTAAAECIKQIHASPGCVGEEMGTGEAAAPRTYEGAGGSWDVGWLDPVKYVGQLQFLPILHESYYIVRAPIAAKLVLPSDNAGKPNEKRDFGESGMIRGLSPKMWGLTVFDSGTAHSLIPPSVFEILKAALLSQLKVQLQAHTSAAASAEARGLSRIFDDMCVPAPADGFSKMTIAKSFPVLQLVFRGISVEAAHDGSHRRPFSLSWGPEYYLYASPNNPFGNLTSGRSAGNDGLGSDQWLCSGIIASGDRTVLGASFLRAFYTVFDRANKRIGVAPSTSKCIPTDACIKSCSTASSEEVGGALTTPRHTNDRRGHLPPHPLSPEASVAAFVAIGLCLGCRRRCGRTVLSMCGRCCGASLEVGVPAAI